MSAPNEMRPSRAVGFFYRCTPCFSPRTYVLLFLLTTDYCAQVKTSDLGLNLVTTDALKTDVSSIDTKKTQAMAMNDVTDRFLETFLRVGNITARNDSRVSELLDSDGDYDDYSLSYDVPEVLFDFEQEEMVLSLTQESPQGRRKKPQVGFTVDQQKELLRLHNFYRGNVTPPSADMSFMEWDDGLTQMAQSWANTCSYKHGFPANYTFRGGHISQNLYWGFDPTGVKAMSMWYEEYQHYHLENLTCTPLQMCGHYTEMVWNVHRFVGCGRKWCRDKRNHYIVCHYFPTGNIHGIPPYSVGKSCSQCPGDSGGLCTRNLCVTEDQCERNQEDCDPHCPLECHNCGVLNATTCKCICADGWESLDCSRWCRNQDKRCGKTPGWPTYTSCSSHRAIANKYCRKMCRKCRGVEDLNSTSVCCRGLECDEGHVIDLNHNSCECRLLCPGPKCYEDREAPFVVEESRSGSQELLQNSYAILFYTLIAHVLLFL